MMHWGYSMSLFHPLWPDKISQKSLEQGFAAIKKAFALSTTASEKSYINAVSKYYNNWQTNPDKLRVRAWADAHKEIYQQYPDDIDAAAFFALSELAVANKQDPTFGDQKRVGTLLDKLRKTSPEHPGLIHYAIHAYDSAPLAKFGIDASRAYDKIAPNVPHALHMPSHIFVRLGMWNEVVNWNIRSAKAALNYSTKQSTSAHYTHAMDYMVYGYLQLKNTPKAKQAVEQMELHHPIQSIFSAAYALASIPARMALEQKNWYQASQLKTRFPDYISWQKFPQIEAITYYAKGLGAARSGDLKAAKENLNYLDALYDKTHSISPNFWGRLVDAQRQTVSAWIKYASGNKKKALAQLRLAADLEDSMDKSPVTPGAVLPSRELLADMLMLTGDYTNALVAYNQCLSISPGRGNSLRGASDATQKMVN